MRCTYSICRLEASRNNHNQRITVLQVPGLLQHRLEIASTLSFSSFSKVLQVHGRKEEQTRGMVIKIVRDFSNFQQTQLILQTMLNLELTISEVDALIYEYFTYSKAKESPDFLLWEPQLGRNGQF